MGEVLKVADVPDVNIGAAGLDRREIVETPAMKTARNAIAQLGDAVKGLEKSVQSFCKACGLK